MRKPTNNIHGEKFGRLTAIEPAPKRDRRSRWIFACDCGNILESRVDAVRSGATVSCGCFMRESQTTHGAWSGGKPTRLWKIWDEMRGRCSRPKNINWLRYGGAGISVCDEWADFAVFEKWALANGYSAELTIDRIDGSLGYSPENCRWATAKEQAANRKFGKKVNLFSRKDREDIRSFFKSCPGWDRILADRYNVPVYVIRGVCRPLATPRSPK